MLILGSLIIVNINLINFLFKGNNDVLNIRSLSYKYAAWPLFQLRILFSSEARSIKMLIPLRYLIFIRNKITNGGLCLSPTHVMIRKVKCSKRYSNYYIR